MKNLDYFKNYSNTMVFQYMQENLFNVFENNSISSEVLELIKNGEFDNDPVEFKKSLSKSKHAEMLTSYAVNDLKKMKLFKVKGFNIGFALKKKDGKFNEIVAVHNNEPNVRGIGEELVKSAIKEGGEYLDHFDGYLTPFYQKLGFVEIARDKFDPQYDLDGSFRSKYGEADVIYRKLKK